MADSDQRQRVFIDVVGAAIPIDVMSADDTVTWALENSRIKWETLVTPNLHHLRVAIASPSDRSRYANATLSLPDGWPVAWLASRVSGRRLQRVTGADIFQLLVEQAGDGAPLVLVGGSPGHELEALADRCTQRGWNVSLEPALRPELTDLHSRNQLAERVARAGDGGVVVIGVGTPRQEAFAEEISSHPGAGAILCLGMSINFTAGVARRAPLIIRRLHFEWAFRALQEPRRLLIRYAADSIVLVRLLRSNPRSRSIGTRPIPISQTDPQANK